VCIDTQEEGNCMINNDKPIRQLLTWLIKATKGGRTRSLIIKNLKKSPQNANQLATIIKVDYKTIRHHLTILEKNKIIVPVGEHYSTAYFLSPSMEENYPLFEEIITAANDKQKKVIKLTQK
jgi:predicted transcriptional regulator